MILIALPAGDMMDKVFEQMGSEGMGQMMPNMNPGQIEHMMRDMMPRMIDSCFAEMDRERWRQ